MTARTSRKIRTEGKRLFVHPSRNGQIQGIALGSRSSFPGQTAQNLANTCSCPEDPLNYEPMFVQKEKKSSRVTARAADAIDLMIEFATLGEYGLEYPEPVRESSRRKTTPDIRMDREEHRHGAGPQRHRHGRRPCRPGRTRVDLPGWGERPRHEVPGVQPDRRHKAQGKLRNRPTAALPEALRPPRIRLEAA